MLLYSVEKGKRAERVDIVLFVTDVETRREDTIFLNTIRTVSR